MIAVPLGELPPEVVSRLSFSPTHNPASRSGKKEEDGCQQNGAARYRRAEGRSARPRERLRSPRHLLRTGLALARGFGLACRAHVLVEQRDVVLSARTAAAVV